MADKSREQDIVGDGTIPHTEAAKLLEVSEATVRRRRTALGVQLESPAVSKPRILVYDIETSPNLAHIYDIFTKHGISPNMVIQPTEILSFAAKWLDEPKVMFYSQYHTGYESMVQMLWVLLDEADAVIHFNGKRFDTLHANREFVQQGWPPPSPYKQIDLYSVVKRNFRFPSSSLNYVSQALGLGAKVEHGGYELWRKVVLDNDPDAWKLMRKYNIQDVVLTQKLYYRLQPWINGHISHAAFTGQHVCPNCGSANLTKQGYAYTSVSTFQRYRCECGKWSRSNKRENGTSITEVS
jgi:uncharacterized protein YprB with RNaseH-like and TPR domain